MTGKGRGISSRLASPKSVLKEEGRASSEGQSSLIRGSSLDEAGARHQPHRSASQVNSWSIQSLAGIDAGLDSKLLKESPELELRFREVDASAPISTSADEQPGSGGNLHPDDCTPCTSTVQEPLAMNGSSKAISKRRPRASRRVPTMVLEASCTNFRDMVQKLTGVAVAPALQKGADLLGAHVVRPQPKRANVETTSSETSQSFYPSVSTSAQNPEFQGYSHHVAQQLALPVSQAPQAPNSNGQSNLGNILGYNNGADIMGSIYGALARSSNRSPIAAAAAHKSSPAIVTSLMDLAAAPAKDFTMPFLAELGLPNSRSNVRSAPKFSDPDLLAAFDSASRDGTVTNMFSETKPAQGLDFMSTSSRYNNSTSLTNAEFALARLKGLNPAQEQEHQQLSFSQMLQDNFWFQSDQVTGSMRVV